MTDRMPASRVVLVTGAAGGLGQGLVAAFAQADWSVAASYHHTPAKASGERVWTLPLDVTEAQSIDAGMDAIVDRWGRLDVLVNAAGVIADQLTWKTSDADWEHVLAVNLKGAFLCSQAAARLMLRQASGQIVQIGSWSGRNGSQGQASYAASKAGLIGLTQSLARELGSSNVRVNAVLPGLLLTRMTSALPPATLAKRISENVLGRMNTISEVADFVVCLAGLQNVSGQVFQLDSRIAAWI